MVNKCWCGNSLLEEFSAFYLKCSKCGTLISSHVPENSQPQVTNEDEDFYGRNYWLERQQSLLRLPAIQERARQDIPERCIHWLRTLLKYKLPPGEILELGSAHGGFVAMMNWAGFDAVGLELSPWVVAYAKATFGVSVLVGPVEKTGLEPGSLDVIVLMDVLEHLQDPVQTLNHCATLLRENGIFLVQTPNLPEHMSYQGLINEKAPFLEHLSLEKGHLRLFSKRSGRMLFQTLGWSEIKFEPAVFSHYDMFFIVGRSPLREHSPEEISEALCTKPSGRLILALLDLDLKGKNTLQECESDRTARLEVIHSQGDEISVLKRDLHTWLEEAKKKGEELAAVKGELHHWLEEARTKGEEVAFLKGEVHRWLEECKGLYRRLEELENSSAQVTREHSGKK
jgi:2-polyprenyl-3-methyl-5-hydroxy-6-metoxy-1,4-benzoquinol methylase